MQSKHKPHIDWFRDAAPYINAHRGKTVVIALSGEAIADTHIKRLTHDVALLHFLGVKIILVHGSRQQINAQLTTLQIEQSFHNNTRITSKTALAPVLQAVMQTTSELTAHFSEGLPNTPMSGACITVSTGNYIGAKPIGVIEGVDMQHTGKVREVHCDAINQLLEQQHLIILPNIGYSKTGEVFNLSMVDVATQTAIKMKADKLIFMTNDDFYQEKNNFSNGFEVRDWIAQSNLDSESAEMMFFSAHAIDHQVNRVHLIDYHIDGGLLLELFTRDGCGCLISNQNYQGLRQAKVKDLTGIYQLIKPLMQAGQLVERSIEQLEADLHTFSVVELDGMICACAAIYLYPNDQAEFACLAVHQDYQNQGFASRLLQHIESQAKSQHIKTIYSLSTQAEHWFLSKGFTKGDLSLIPEQKQAAINKDRHSKILIKNL